jgi:DNA-binding LacI/PurR family transcriptional regulator
MLEDILSTVLKDRFDIQLIHGADHNSKLVDAAVVAGASVIVVSCRDPSNLALIDPHLAKAAEVSIVALALDGASAFLHTFTPSKEDLEEVSAERIRAKIEAAAARRDDCLDG